MHKLWSAFTKALRSDVCNKGKVVKVDYLGSFRLSPENQIKFVPSIIKMTTTSGFVVNTPRQSGQQEVDYAKIEKVTGVQNAKQLLDRVIQKAIKISSSTTVSLNFKVGTLFLHKGSVDFTPATPSQIDKQSESPSWSSHFNSKRSYSLCLTPSEKETPEKVIKSLMKTMSPMSNSLMFSHKNLGPGHNNNFTTTMGSARNPLQNLHLQLDRAR